MNTALNIILAVSFTPIWPIIYFLMRNTTKPKKNVILGATLPKEAHDDEEVREILRGFRRWLDIFVVPLLPLLIPPFFMRMTGAAMTWFMVWLLIIVVAPFAVFGVYREKLMVLKREKGWRSDAEGLTVADVKAAALPVRKISDLWFLPAAVMALLPIIVELLALLTSSPSPSPPEQPAMVIYVTFALTGAIFWVIYHWVFRLRSEIVNEDLALTLALTRMRRYNLGKMCLFSAWATGALNLLVMILGVGANAFVIIIMAYTLLLISLAMYAEFATRGAQRKLTEAVAGTFYVDEDDHWLWGQFYYNPNDKHFLVNDRIGMGTSVNMAKIGGKITMGFALLSLVAMPFIGIWMWVGEATPAKLAMSETALTALHTGDQYVIPLDVIESAEIAETMPVVISRDNGWGMNNLNKGRFTVRGLGSAYLCVMTQNPPFLIIKADGRTYILNDEDSSVTKEVFARLTQ